MPRYRRTLPVGIKYLILPDTYDYPANQAKVPKTPVLYAQFKGSPPEFDTDEAAKEYVDWMVKMRKIPYEDVSKKKEFEKIHKIIHEFVLNHEDYKIGKIYRHDADVVLEMYPCPYAECKTAQKIFSTADEFQKHIQEFHFKTPAEVVSNAKTETQPTL